MACATFAGIGWRYSPAQSLDTTQNKSVRRKLYERAPQDTRTCWPRRLSLRGCEHAAQAADRPAEIPKCDKKVGTLAVNEPRTAGGRSELESPEALIKVFVAESGCFTLVDRGKVWRQRRPSAPSRAW